MIVGLLLLIVILFTGIDELMWEIKKGKLFKKQKDSYSGKTGYDFANDGETYEAWGCGTWFLILIIMGVIFFFGIIISQGT